MWKIVVIIAGGVIAFAGWEEFRLRSIARAEPAGMTLAALVNATSIDNAHVKLSGYAAIYPELIYRAPKRSDTKITEAYYPILSSENTFMQRLAALAERFPDGVPETEALPQIENFKVVVKTKRFKAIDEIPTSHITGETVQGMIVNEVESLGGEEMALLKQSFPKLDAEAVLVLEEFRAPASATKAGVQMIGGSVLALVGFGLLIARRGRGG